jgi:exopolysaccharide biosynthesis polyprenyl glycosylphosphotransferase
MDTADERAPNATLQSLQGTADSAKRAEEIIRYRRGRRFAVRRGRLVKRSLAVVDAFGLIVSFLFAELAFGGGGRNGPFNTSTETLLFLATVPGWLLFAKLYGLYDRDEQRTDHTTSDEIVGVVHMVTMGTWLFFALSWLAHFAAPDLAKVFAFWGVAVILLPLGRVFARAGCRRRLAYVQNTLVYGAGKMGQEVACRFLRHPEYGVNLVGFVDSSPSDGFSSSNGCRMLGPSENLPDIIERFDIDRMVIASPAESHDRVVERLRAAAELQIHIDIVPSLDEFVSSRVDVHAVEGLPLIGLPSFTLTRTQRRLKRTMDVLLSSIGLVLLAPVFALLATLIKLDSPGPIFFRQLRMGAGEKPFGMLKFRTMTVDADTRKAELAHLNKHAAPGGDARMFKIADDPRVTRVGRFIRRYSLDELPQLVNVLTNEMTLVGPRPLILEEDQYVAGWARKRLDLKPGMTGLWQVLGRNEIPFQDMVRLDYLYVTSWSLWRDCLLLLRTVPLMLKGVRESY